MTTIANDELGITNDECPIGAFHSSFVIRHSSFLCIVFLLLSCLSRPLPGQGQTADTLIKDALAAYQSGNLDAAIAQLRQAHKAAPSNQSARLYLGILLYQKDPASLEAQGLMESILDRYPTNSDLLLRLTDSYLASHKETKISSLLERSKQARGANHRLALNIIYVLVRYGQVEPAGRELDEFYAALQNSAAKKAEQNGTTTADPALAREMGEVYFIRGLIAATSGQKDEAMRQFQAADRSDFPPQDSPQMKMLAEALFRFEEYALSAQAYKAYLSHFPQDINARLQLSVCYFSSTAFTRAKEQLQMVYEKAPEMPEVNYYMGLVALESKSLEEARRYFEAELKINPVSYQAMTEMAYLEYARGDNEKCRQWLEKAAALSPDWPELNFVYGLLYNRMGTYDLAVKSLEKTVQSNPRHIKAQLQLSIAYRRIGNEVKAKEHADIYNQLLEAHKERTLGDDPRKR